MQQESQTYRRSQRIDAPADQVFAWVSQVGNLPQYLPPVTSAQSTGGDGIRIHVEIPNQGGADGEGYFRANRQARRMEWGATMGRDYSGTLTVAPMGDTQSEVTVEVNFGPHSVEPEAQAHAAPGRDPMQESLAATLESVRRQIEGEGGKVQTPAPPPR